jgi:hypothetical protein
VKAGLNSIYFYSLIREAEEGKSMKILCGFTLRPNSYFGE